MELEKFDLGKSAPPVATLRDWISRLSIDGIISTKSPAYRSMGLAEKALSENAAIALFQKDRNLLRRPIAVIGDRIIVGFSATDYDEALGA